MTPVERSEAAAIARRWTTTGRIAVAAALPEETVNRILMERDHRESEKKVPQCFEKMLSDFLKEHGGEFTGKILDDWLVRQGSDYTAVTLSIYLKRACDQGLIKLVRFSVGRGRWCVYQRIDE